MERENDKSTIINSSRDGSSERHRKHKKEKKSKKHKHRSSSRDDRCDIKKDSKRNRSPSSRDSRKNKETSKTKRDKGEKESAERKSDKYLNKYKHKDKDFEAAENANTKKQKSEKDEFLDNDETTVKETKSNEKKFEKKQREKDRSPRNNSREKHRRKSRSKSRSHKRRGSGSRERSRSRERRRERESERERKCRRGSSRDRDRRSRSRQRSRGKYGIRSKSNERSFLADKLPILDIKNKFEEIARFTSENAPISTSDESKRDRELYVANLPKGLTPKEVTELLNSALVAIEANLKPGDPILSAWINPDQNYALLEFRDARETQNAFKLNGLKLIDKEIKIGKPRYEGENTNQQIININLIEDMFPTLTGFEKDLNNPVLNRSITSGNTYSNAAVPYSSHSVTQTVLPTCSKLLVSNLPLDFNQESVYKVLKIYGPIKTLEMIKDPITGNYSGQCHVEYENEKATSKALHYAMGINLKGNILYIKRSSGLVPTYSVSAGGAPTSLGILTNGLSTNLHQQTQQNQYMTAEDYVKFRENTSSQVICIRNMVNLKDLADEDEYDDLMEDVREECKIYGKVIDVKIPRPEAPKEIVPGLGKIFVEYATRDGAAFAKENLNGKSFHGRFVEVVFHPEEMYRKNQLD